MKTKWMIMMAATAVLGFSSTVQATLITGSINFSGNGTATLNGPVASATAVTFSTAAGPETVSGGLVAPTGSYVTTPSLVGDTVNFLTTGFTFSPALNPNPVVNLWSFTASGITYSFSLSSVVFAPGAGGAWTMGGLGTLAITGFQNTIGTWNLASAGTGPLNFGFTSGNLAVPDGGTTVLLLGAALSGLGLLRKKLTA